MKLYRLNKIVLNFKNNAAQILNGLTSNEMDKPRNAFLNIHGRIIATFDQFKVSDDEVTVILEEKYVDLTLEHLDRYLRLGGVKVEKLNRNVYFDLEKGQPIVTIEESRPNVTEDEFTLFRLCHHIPLQGVDYTDEFILNVSDKDFVSFTKGCFLGQEPVAKVHNRSKPSWKLVVKSENDCTDEELPKLTSKVLDPETGKWMGFVFVRNS